MSSKDCYHCLVVAGCLAERASGHGLCAFILGPGEWQRKDLHESSGNTGKIIKINFFRTLELTKDLQRSEECVFEKNS